MSPDYAAYDDGWLDGLASYCTPSNAVRVGRSGKRYLRICPEPDTAFREALNVGAGIFRIDRGLANLRMKRESITAELRGDRINAEQRAELTRRLSYIEGSIANLEVRRGALEREAALIRAEATSK